MSGGSVRIRAAAKSDSRLIAELFLISSDGFAEYIWQQVAEPGESVLEAGCRRYARDGVDFSWQNCLMAEIGGTAVAMAHCYPMHVDPDAEPIADPVLRPAAELEDDGSLYLSGLAVLPEHRGRGIGSILLDAVEQRAKRLELPHVSLICFERNTRAMSLYRRRGYDELDRRPIVPHPCLHYTDGDAVLLAKDVSSG